MLESESSYAARLAEAGIGFISSCGERTAKGRPCRNLLSGTLLDFRTWLKAGGKQWHVHGGVGSLKAPNRQ